MRIAFYFYITFLLYLTQSCTEPYALQSQEFESIIVVEASITDEYKFQEIKLSRTYKLEESGPEIETGAIVFVNDNNGNQYDFTENNGVYKSQQKFQAQLGVTYKLTVITSDGKTYTSTNEKIASTTNLESVTANVNTNAYEGRGVQIIANTSDQSEGIKYYRYSYEETNKIITPQWKNFMAEAYYFNPLPNISPYGEVILKPWTYEAKICYSTEKSKDILLSNTSLNSTSTNSSLVRFLKETDYKIANRYSIEITLYNQSLAAYNYYDALKKSSTQGNLLSQNQPGFYAGNIKNNNNPNEKVIGFFDVSHISRERIFFNFEDLFPNQAKPGYPYDCPEITPINQNKFSFTFCWCAPNECDPLFPCSGDYIITAINQKIKNVYEKLGGKYVMVNSQCMDCTSFSSNVKPSFWID